MTASGPAADEIYLAFQEFVLKECWWDLVIFNFSIAFKKESITLDVNCKSALVSFVVEITGIRNMDG